MPTVIALRERQRHLLRLDPLDLAYLRGLPRRWIQVQRVAGTRRHLVTVGGIAGTLLAPTCRFSIAPKVPLASLLGLLDLDEPPATVPLAEGASTPEQLLDLLAGAFLALVRERLRAGLHRGYREQALVAPVLQGRLDLAAQIRHGPTRPDLLHQTVDTFTTNIACNQLIRTALDALTGVEGLTAATRAEWHHLGDEFAAVQPLDPAAWETPLPAPVEYAPVLDLARLLLAGLSQGRANAPAVGFIVELDRLFEKYVLRGLQRMARPGTLVEPQARRILRGPTGPALVIQPDALVLAEGQPVQVIDAKWKRLRRGRPARADLFQILAYADTLAVPEAILVYPGRASRCRRYPPTRRGTQIVVWTLRPGQMTDAFARILNRTPGERPLSGG